jgi:iron complex transport system substrate-binding protein
MRRRLLATLAIAALAGAMAAGCGTTTEGTPSQSSAPNGYPKKIVSLSASATEMLFAIGAGNQVVAVDEYSNYPPNVPKTNLSGFTPNAEAIAAKTPDLVVLSDDSKGIVAQLNNLKIKTQLAPAAKTIDDTYRQIGELGEVTGHAAEAKALNERIKTDLAALVKDLPKRDKPLTYFYELDPALYTATSKTFIGSLFSSAGLVNVADAADPNNTGYPKMSAEALIKANPDYVFLADTVMGESPDKVKARAGWSGVTAVTKSQIVTLDSDIASRWGPRVVELLRAIVNSTKNAS